MSRPLLIRPGPEVLGGAPAPGALAAALGAETRLADAPASPIDDGDVAPVVVWEASEWYLRNRGRISGRRPVVVCSWSFADLRRLVAGVGTLPESGLAAVFHNCPRVPAAAGPVRTQFRWKPCARSAPARPSGPGCPADAADDRDWCLVDRFVRRWGPCPVGRTAPGPSLPVGLSERLSPDAGWDGLSVLVPAPRIGDLAGGVVPPELVEAAVLGVPVLAVRHPVLDPLREWLGDPISSLSDWDAAAAEAASGRLRRPRPRMREDFSCQSLASAVEAASDAFVRRGRGAQT